MTSVEAIFGMTESERVLFRLRTLHRDRVEAIREDKAVVRLSDPSRLVVHLMPECAGDATKDCSATEVKGAAKNIVPLGARNGSFGDSRFNADGVLFFGGRSYSQLYRNGVYEGVMAEVVYKSNEQGKILRETECEAAMLGALAGYLNFSKTLGLQPPFWMCAAMIGCEGAKICLSRSWSDFSNSSIDRNVVWLPFLKVDTFEVDSAKSLRPMFDVLWNSVGLERSFNYDEHGNRRVRQ